VLVEAERLVDLGGEELQVVLFGWVDRHGHVGEGVDARHGRRLVLADHQQRAPDVVGCRDEAMGLLLPLLLHDATGHHRPDLGAEPAGGSWKTRGASISCGAQRLLSRTEHPGASWTGTRTPRGAR